MLAGEDLFLIPFSQGHSGVKTQRFMVVGYGVTKCVNNSCMLTPSLDALNLNQRRARIQRCLGT
jgi:hypothetical protein